MKELLFVILLVEGTWSITVAQQTDDAILNRRAGQTAEIKTKSTSTSTSSIGPISDNYDQKNAWVSLSFESTAINGHLLCVDSTTRGVVKGTIVDPLEPDFEMYTSKIVLLRESFLPTGTAALTRTLKDILSADPIAIIILTESEAGVNSLGGLSASAIPVVTIALKESAEILFAVKNRRQVSLAIK